MSISVIKWVQCSHIDLVSQWPVQDVTSTSSMEVQSFIFFLYVCFFKLQLHSLCHCTKVPPKANIELDVK